MSQVTVGELHRDAVDAIDRVKRGEHIDITERGVVIARLVPTRDGRQVERDGQRFICHARGAERC
jgi:antitoxin (DNA-binding transcriptional repressor) of toxin-antitoxin stability system